MITRIFKVEYRCDEYTDGKFNDTVRDFISVVAKDASHAISKVSERVLKPHSYTSEETKKKVNVTAKNFEPINVTLTAEAE